MNFYKRIENFLIYISASTEVSDKIIFNFRYRKGKINKYYYDLSTRFYGFLVERNILKSLIYTNELGLHLSTFSDTEEPPIVERPIAMKVLKNKIWE